MILKWEESVLSEVGTLFRNEKQKEEIMHT